MKKQYGYTNCAECGNFFEKKLYNQLCCSKQCADIRNRKECLKKYHILPKNYSKCGYCGKEINKKGHHTWCSVECRLKDTRENKNKICIFCGKEFLDISTNTKLCSDECRKQWKKKCDLEYSRNNKDKVKINHKKWRDENREYVRSKNLEWAKNNQDKLLLKSKLRWKQVKSTPKLAIDARMSNLIWKALKENKNGKSWKEMVSYTVEDLKNHLESLFTEGMTWERFLNGEIHIDHILPRCSFTYDTGKDPINDQGFQKCWSLKNLQPLWAADNLRKGSKIIEGVLSNE